MRPWNGELVVDWAEQQDEPDEETMSQVKVLYIKNLKESVTDERLQEMFAKYGEIERIKKIRDYAFVHYMQRESAVAVRLQSCAQFHTIGRASFSGNGCAQRHNNRRC